MFFRYEATVDGAEPQPGRPLVQVGAGRLLRRVGPLALIDLRQRFPQRLRGVPVRRPLLTGRAAAPSDAAGAAIRRQGDEADRIADLPGPSAVLPHRALAWTAPLARLRCHRQPFARARSCALARSSWYDAANADHQP